MVGGGIEEGVLKTAERRDLIGSEATLYLAVLKIDRRVAHPGEQVLRDGRSIGGTGDVP